MKLKELTETYENVTVWAFPCNQFGGQEPKSSNEIREHVAQEFSVDFPIFDKIKVNGPDAHPLYKYLKSAVKHESFWANFFSNSIKWNFTKFLCVNGVPLKRFEPLESFRSIEKLIEKYQ
jgi:glutathione peroxidase